MHQAKLGEPGVSNDRVEQALDYGSHSPRPPLAARGPFLDRLLQSRVAQLEGEANRVLAVGEKFVEGVAGHLRLLDNCRNGHSVEASFRDHCAERESNPLALEVVDEVLGESLAAGDRESLMAWKP
ncbi:MAG TPA: hypothetical protein VKB23_04575 [Solirubrobacterales bacterium]|nr:hypothetical protein [Solirubrobacterales bacterium]